MFKRILILAPHTDDAELGCGGSMARFHEEGCELHVAAFSTAQGSLPEGAPPTTLRDEFLSSMRALGLPDERVHVYDWPVRKLNFHRQDVLEELVALRRSIEPDAVFLPSGNDLHQDHQVLFAEGTRAFKDMTIWGYELPWNHITFSAQAFVELEPRHLDTKIEILRHYQSQIELGRPYFDRSFVESLARVRGLQVKGTLAEAFEVVRIKI